MSTLSGQTIQSTYQGLLKLSNSTTGITSSLQSIEDGLGGNTGIRIATDQIESPNFNSIIPLMARYYGPGASPGSGSQPYTAGSQGEIMCMPFYDKGEYAYSAMSYYISTATTVSDTIDAAFYTSQMINPNGVFPHTQVLSGFTLTTTGSTGLKTTTFPTNLSFSGYGGGIFWLVWKFTSANNPNVRYGTPNLQSILPQITQILGVAQGFGASPVYQAYWRSNQASFLSGFMYFSGLTTFDNPYANTIDTLQSTNQSVGGNGIGFLLHTVGA